MDIDGLHHPVGVGQDRVVRLQPEPLGMIDGLFENSQEKAFREGQPLGFLPRPEQQEGLCPALE